MSLRSFRLVLFAIAALLLTPSVASAAWTVPPTPNVAGADFTNLSAVDCSSAIRAWPSATRNLPRRPGCPPRRGGRALGRYGLADRAVPQSARRHLEPAERRLVSAAERLLRSRLLGPVRRFGDRSSSAGTGRAGRSSRARTSRAARSGLSPAPGSGLHRGRERVGALSRPLAERWDGTGWHVQSTPDAADTDTDSSLMSRAH